MALHRDLLTQARLLAFNEPKRPKQVSLRRAASAACYALFHFLIDRSTRLIVSGGGPERQALLRAAARGFTHGHMMKTSKAFGGSGDDKWKGLLGGPVPPDLEVIASAFADLQLARHEADYDLSRDFNRGEVSALIAQAEHAISLWSTIADEPITRAYLLGLVLTTR